MTRGRARLVGLATAAAFLCAATQAEAGGSGAANTPMAVSAARATVIPACALYVDAAAAAAAGDGTAQKPHKTIAAAVAAARAGAVICVAEGLYAEQIAPGVKNVTLAGGFQRGFKLRDSAVHVSKAQGNGGGSFYFVKAEGPEDGGLSAIDGFEITGYAQAIFRDYYVPQRFDVTNNNIHDNACGDDLTGAGLALNNVSGTISGNVFRHNRCGRGGGISLNDDTNKNSVKVERNLFEGNAGTETETSHGGAFYGGANTLAVTGNAFIGNTVTKWGAGLYVTAYPEGGQPVTATMKWNVYRGNRAGIAGGGFFCDGGAKCISSNELYDGNCGGNVYVDSGSETSGPTIASFDRITNVGARAVGCEAPGVGVRIDIELKESSDQITFTNALFWGNAEGRDFTTGCNDACKLPKVTVSSSMAQTKFLNNGLPITFGAGMIAPADPRFVAPEKGDYRLQPGSPATGKGAYAAGDTPPPLIAPVATPAVAPAASPAPSAEATQPAQADVAPTPPETVAPATAPVPESSAASAPAAVNDVTAKQAFDDAKDLGTAEGWNVFLKTYPNGFYADLARAYLKKLAPAEAAPAGGAATAPRTAPQAPAATAAPVPDKASSAPTAPSAAPAQTAPLAKASPKKPAITRGVKFLGFPEKFNRYYTDAAWAPSRTLYVSAAGGGDGATRETAMAAKDAVAAAKPGAKLHFTRGSYQGCFEFTKENSGTYDEPVVVFAERNEDQSIGVKLSCCVSGRQTCFNLEQADYVAIDGFEMIGGRYGVRAVGEGYPASQHSRGVVAMNCKGHDQNNDPFFTGQSDWLVLDNNVAYGAKAGDGHGIYISNGSDWNIVRNNETYDNTRSDFQINADPNSTCKEVGVPFDDPRCDAYAGTGEGGQGVSDYFLVENNHFHHGKTNGPNFTSVRRSVVRNNIMGFQGTHNVSFWQETDNLKLGSSENRILHNLFVSTGKVGVQFMNGSNRNEFANNIVIGVTPTGAAHPSASLMEVDETSKANTFRGNVYASGKLEGRAPTAQEMLRPDFSAQWFARFPTALNHSANDYAPTAQAPYLGLAPRSADAGVDLNGVTRPAKATPGPIEPR